MRAIRKDFGMEIEVELMGKDEMPDDGLTYYHDPETYIIYREEELKFINQPTNQ